MKLRALLAAVIVLSFIGAAMTVSPDFRWKAIVGARKLAGQAGNVTWLDLWYLVRPHSGFQLKKLASSGNPYTALQVPEASSENPLAGKQLFARNCARCHGDDASGGIGPRLVGARLKHGEGDWAIYRTIMDGVDGTAMQGGLLTRAEAWRVIGYLRDLKRQGAGAAQDAQRLAAPATDITSAALVDSAANVGQWLLHSGAYDGQRFSRDRQVDAANVSRLKVEWIHQFAASDIPNESTPIVSGTTMFVTVPPGTLVAIDTASGNELWHYDYPLPEHLRMIWLTTNRGVSVLGRNVYWATPDAHLLALDTASGKLIWDTTIANYVEGYSMTSPPLPVGDMVVAGVAGGDYPVRGFITAYDAATGAVRWRFNTVPGPGEPGNETWSGDSWKTGGAAAWGTGVYDPQLGLIYWGVGNPNPDFNASLRVGDNLYSNCELALDAKTGKLAWYFQFTPGDDHDWDSTQTPSLIDLDDGGTTAKLLAVANRNGFFYVLDRRTGHFVRALAFVKETWASSLTAAGRPIRAENSSPTREGNLIYPSSAGGTTWWPSAYSPETRLYYTNVRERGGIYFRAEPPPRPRVGEQFLAGAWTFVEDEPFKDYVRAIDPATATVRWERRNATATAAPRGGLLATAGGLLFGSDGSTLYALDAGSGAQLWSFNTGAQISAPPITYRLGDSQVIAVVAGNVVVTFNLAEEPRTAHR